MLEFLIKNGSERVIDDARSHLSLLKMLRQFHFIDQNGKDQGVNVRNRSKELTELLSDVDRIRAERKKARNNRNKFGGVEGSSTFGSGLSSGSKYGGFGSGDSGSYGAYSGGVFGDGGGYGGNTSGFQDSSSRRGRFEEYDEYDEGAVTSSGRRKPETPSISAAKRESKKIELPKKKEPEIDIMGFDNDIPPETPPKESLANGKKAALNAMDDSLGAADDDFDDFQSAVPVSLPPPLSTISTTSSTQFAAPKPVSGTQSANLNDLVGFNSSTPNTGTTNMASPSSSSFSSLSQTGFQQPKQLVRPTGYQATQPNYFTSVPVPSATPQSSSSISAGFTSPLSSNTASSKTATKPASSGADVFDSLWSTASAGAGIKKANTPGTQGPNLASMAKEKASAGIWGASASTTKTTQTQAQTRSGGTNQRVGGGLDDLLG